MNFLKRQSIEYQALKGLILAMKAHSDAEADLRNCGSSNGRQQRVIDTHIAYEQAVNAAAEAFDPKVEQ